MKEKNMDMEELKEMLVMNEEEIKIILELPPKERNLLLEERLFRVTIMKALIESGTPEEEARKVLTDPNAITIVEEDEYGNKREYHPYH